MLWFYRPTRQICPYTSFGEDECITTSVRRDKWKPKKDGPRIPPSKYVYDWDIEPGTTYAVSIRIFNIEQRWELMGMECKPWVAEDGAVCPYLTIEYKCRAKNGKPSHAMYQNTAASVLWLHQRRQIRKALGRTLAGLKHFSVSFFDSSYSIWEACFQGGQYHLHNLVEGDLIKIDDLKLYIEWSNAIHCWGLGPNASSFKDDIVALLDYRQKHQCFPPSMDHPAEATQDSTMTPPTSVDSGVTRSGEEVIPTPQSS